MKVLNLFRRQKKGELRKEAKGEAKPSEPKPDIRFEYDKKLGKYVWRRYYSEHERFVPMSYVRREALKLLREMKEPSKMEKLIPLSEVEEHSKNLIKETLERVEKEESLKPVKCRSFRVSITENPRIEIIKGVLGNHSQLMNYAIRMLMEKGFEVFPEYKLKRKGKGRALIIDLVGVKGKEKVAVECGTLSRTDKLNIILEEGDFDRVIWIPYSYLLEGQLRKNTNPSSSLMEEQNKT